MAQTQGAKSKAGDWVVEVSTDGSTWTNITGSTTSFNLGTQSRDVGETKTGDGKGVILTAGKLGAITGQFRTVYTEISGEAFEVMRAAHEGDGRLYVRATPGGLVDGNKQYTSATPEGTATPGVISEFFYPEGDAASADSIPAGFDVMVPAWLQSAYSA